MANLPTDLSDQLQYAIYMPAIFPPYARMAIEEASAMRPIAGGRISPKDLNFLDPSSKLLYLPAALYSAGLAKELNNVQPCMVSQRNRDHSHVIADSGGYQVMSGYMKAQTTEQRQAIYDWQRRVCDAGMTLDVPTASLEVPASGYKQFSDCLGDTVQHLADYQSFHQRDPFQLMNVLQGRTVAESDLWYGMVKGFGFNGWAFAGDLKTDWYLVIRRMLIIRDEGLWKDQANWVHVLGTGSLSNAALLTVLRDGMRRLLDDAEFHISFDSATPFSAAGRRGEFFHGYKFSASSMSVDMTKIKLDNPHHIGSSQPLPSQNSPVARAITMGELVIKQGTHADSRADMLSYNLLMNNNIYVQVAGVLAANRELSKPRALTLNTVPSRIYNAAEAIREIFDAKDPWDMLHKRKPLLDAA